MKPGGVSSRTIEISVDGGPLSVRGDANLLVAALEAGVYIPHLCHHPDLPSFRAAQPTNVVFRAGERIEGDEAAMFEGCGLCAVEVAGQAEPRLACELPVSPGLAVRTATPELVALRRAKLAKILTTHPHACITCAQSQGCSREPCSTSVALAERCCPLLGRCELEKLARHIGVPPDTPRYVPRGLPAVTDDPLIAWAPELCVSCLRCVRACSDLKDVGAMSFVRREGQVIVGLVAADRLAAGCRYCGACIEVCPTGALIDRAAVTAEREARLVPCRTSCPAGMDVPRFLRAVAGGLLEEAARVALDRLPLPNVLGRICFHPCEDDCRRRELGGALSVCRLRRQVFDTVSELAPPWPSQPSSGKRVAVIGAGPAGLAAAHFLRRLGHEVTVFEAEAGAGGMLRHGIPAYRLPREVLDRDLTLLAAWGIEFRFGMALGRDASLNDLKPQSFAAIVLAVGAGAAKALPVAGATLEGVLPGVDFLRDVAAGRLVAPAFAGRTVLVIGGGNVAVDTARSALRLGASSVTLACLETAEEMPAYRGEIAAARQEGVSILTSWGVGELLGANGAVRGALLVRCLSVFDGEGRFAPRLDPATAQEVGADAVIVAIGQEVDRAFATAGEVGLAFRGDGLLGVAPGRMETDLAGVFACGDVILGPSSVVRSIANGRRAAEAVDRFLGGSGEVPSILEQERPDQRIGPSEGFAARERAALPELPPAERIASFAEVELTLEAEHARIEAGRCLQCDLRLLLCAPALPPPPWRSLAAAALVEVPASEGVYQLLGEDLLAVKIAGTPSLREALAQELARDTHPPYFLFEVDPMFTKRESELIQQFLSLHGHMPTGDADLDDLY